MPVLDGHRTQRASGQHVLVGGAERRRTGSHYTPTTLTRPIVERTLGPVLGDNPTAERILDCKVCDPAMGSGAFLAEACRYLAQRLLDAWTREGTLPPAAEGDPLLAARRQVAERCLYGVDKNAFAVQLARLSLWLVTLAKDKPFTFVDHALREGDAVIGLDVHQIASFEFQPGRRQQDWVHELVRHSIKSAIRDRAHIVEPAPLFDWRDEHRWKKQYLIQADDEVLMARRRGDLLLASAWDRTRGREAKSLYGRLRRTADSWLKSDGDTPLSGEAGAMLATLDEVPLRPFHWPLEFPEVFARSNPGFDAVVGNPPFGGKHTIGASSGDRYIQLFQRLFPHAHGKSDLCVYFLLVAWVLIRRGGGFGLIGTNSIRQGVTRDTGLKHLLAQGATIYAAATDMKWPVTGVAVVVDVVHLAKGEVQGAALLNDEMVDEINSMLTAGPELADPTPLKANSGRAYQGSVILGTGFMLDPAEAQSLLDADPAADDVIRPLMGGQELNGNLPDERGFVNPSRFVIDFGDLAHDGAARYPRLLQIVTERVKPLRDKSKRTAYRERWWRFAERQTSLYSALAPISRCLTNSQVSKHHLFGFQPTDRIFSHALNVFAFDDWFSFAVLQSRIHEAWSRGAGLGSTLETRTRYTPSTVFETFPFPRPTPPQRVVAAAAGQALDEQRTLCMRRFGEGMTKIWNRLLDPDETDPEIEQLRGRRDAMDGAVLAAYGWDDLGPNDAETIVARLRKLNAACAAAERRRP